jgi:hypothetical protein
MIASLLLVASALTPIADAVGSPEARAAFTAIASRAECTSPAGKTFTTEIVALADGRTRMFQQHAEGRRAEILVDGGRAFRRETREAPLQPAPEDVVSFVRGHEIHRMILDLDRRFRPTGEGTAAAACLEAVGPDALPARICRGEDGALPTRIELTQPDGQTVAIELDDWRELFGVRLPFAAVFVSRGERWSYRFVDVLPFRLAPEVDLPAQPQELFDRLGDLAELTAAHGRALEAHRRGDVELLLADEAGSSTVSRRGELVESRRDRLRRNMSAYLGSTYFSRYEDVELPIVAVALDGSMGWLACRIEAEGRHEEPDGDFSPVAYGFSWVELYARREGRWLRVGNASSQGS